MTNGRITLEERLTLRSYIGGCIVVVLAAAALYFFVLEQKEQLGMKGFDPNRPVPSDSVLRNRLRSEEYFVTRQNGTQVPFQNEFWNNWRAGIYVDVITNEPLFLSVDKYDNGLGMPSFSKPISKDSIVEKPDTTQDMQRTELRAKRSDAHLGHLLPDKQSPTGQDYSINSAALHFIPMAEMKDRGYGSYVPLLRKK